MIKKVKRYTASFLLTIQLLFSCFLPLCPLMTSVFAQTQTANFSTESLGFTASADGELLTVKSDQDQLQYSYYYLYEGVLQSAEGELMTGENALFIGTQSDEDFIAHDFNQMVFKAQMPGGDTYSYQLIRTTDGLTVAQIGQVDNLDLQADEQQWLSWVISEDAKTATTAGKVVLDETYVFPLDERVSVKFTELPDETSPLSIRRIELNDELTSQYGSEVAFDITTDMTDGEFEYELTLPGTIENSDEVEVIYAESEAALEANEVETIESEKDGETVVEVETVGEDKTVVIVKKLDHMTVFVVSGITDWTLHNGSVCVTGAVNNDGDANENCFGTIQAAINAATAGDTINVAAGTYKESNITIDKKLSIVGEAKESVILAPSAEDTGSGTSSFDGNYQHGIMITADNVSISNLTIDGKANNIENGGTLPNHNNYRIGILNFSSSEQGFDNLSIDNVNINNIRFRGIYLNPTTTSGHQITNSTISNIEYKQAIAAYTSNIVISNNTIFNAGSGIRVTPNETTSSSMTITITDNTLFNIAGTYSQYYGHSWPSHAIYYRNPNVDQTVIITGNNITIGDGAEAIDEGVLGMYIYNADGNSIIQGNTINSLNGEANWGMYIGGCAGTTVDNNTLIMNDTDSGIYLGRGSTGIPVPNIVSNNTLTSTNSISNVVSEGAAIVMGDHGDLFWMWEKPYNTNNTITNNAISGFVRGILLHGDDTSAYYEAGSTVEATITNNDFSNNSLFAVDANTLSNVIDATENWWGTDDSTEFVDKILGDVDYDPWCMDSSCSSMSDSVYSDNKTVASTGASQTIDVGGLSINGTFGAGNIFVAKYDSVSDVPNGGTTFGAENFYYNIDAPDGTTFPIDIEISYSDTVSDSNYLDEDHFVSLYYQKAGVWYDYKLDDPASTVLIDKDTNVITATLNHLTPIVPVVDTALPTVSNGHMYVSYDGGSTYAEEAYVSAGDFVRVEVDAKDDVAVDHVIFRIKDAFGGGYIANDSVYAPVSGDTYRYEFQIPADGKYKNTHLPITETLLGQVFWARSVDTAGNSTNANVAEYFTFDKTIPTIATPVMSVSTDAGATYIVKNVVKPGDMVRIETDATDTLSGVDYVEFRIQNGTTGEYVTALAKKHTASSGDTYRYNFTMPVDGKYVNTHNPVTLGLNEQRAWVRSYDVVGNYIHGKAISFTFDNIVPSVPINGTPDNTFINTNNFDFNWDVSIDTNSPLTYLFVSTKNPAEVGGVLTTGLWQSGVLTSNMIHSSGASDGTWYWQVKAVDPAGNESAWSEIWDVTIDTVAPAIDNVTNIVAEGTATSGSNADVTIVPPMSHDLVDGDIASTCNYSTGNFPYGVTTVTCNKTDNAGNPATPETFTVTVQDTTAPVGTITVNNSILSDSTRKEIVTINYSEPMNTSVSPTINFVGADGTWNVKIAGVWKTPTQYQITYKVSDANEESTSITVASTGSQDLSGLSESSAAVTFDIDTKNPLVIWDTPTNGEYLNGVAILEVTATDVMSGIKFVGFKVKPEGALNSAYVTFINKDKVAPYSYEWDTTDTTKVPADGNYTLQARAKDGVGNITLVHRNVVVDNTAPNVTIVKPLANDVKAGTFTAEATITDTNGLSDVRLRFNDAITNAIVKTYTMTNNSGDTWEYSVDSASDLPDDDYKMRVIATDIVGNKKNVSESPVTIDNTAPSDPTPVSTSHLISTWSKNNTVDVTWSGANDNLSGVDGFYTEWNTSTDTMAGSVTKEYEETDSSETSSVLADGDSHYFHIATVDNAGNWTNTEHLGPFWIDTTVPDVTWVEPLDGATALSGDVTLDVDCDGTPGDCSYINFWWWGPGQTIVDAKSIGQHHLIKIDGTDFTWTLDSINPALWLSGIGSQLDGQYTLRAAGKDLVGNYHHEQITVNFDNTLPESEITYPAPEAGSSVVYSNDWNGMVEGTSSDDNSGVAKVWLSIQRDNGTGNYWNGSAWITSAIEVTFEAVADGNTNSEYDWTYNFLQDLIDNSVDNKGDIPEDSYLVTSHAEDNAGNVENTSQLTIIVDRTIPEVNLTVDPEPADGDNGWFITQPTVTLTATDPSNSGLDVIQYQWDGDTGSWETSTTSPVTFQVPSEGHHRLYYRAVDLAGNKTTIDETSETGIKTLNWDATELDDTDFNVFVSPNPTSDAEATVTWDDASDNVGIDHYQVAWDWLDGDADHSKDVGSDVNETTIDDLQAGEYKITVTAYDHSGHSRSDDTSLTVDRTAPAAPVLTLTGTGDGTVDLSWTAVDDADEYYFLRVRSGQSHLCSSRWRYHRLYC